MNLALVALIGVLFATGTYLMMHRTLTRIILGVGVMGNGVNLLIIATGGPPGSPPVIGELGTFADPVPQALVLTAIVIGFALQAFLLSLAWRNWTLDGNDEVEDDLSDRLMARRDAAESEAVPEVAPPDDDVAGEAPPPMPPDDGTGPGGPAS